MITIEACLTIVLKKEMKTQIFQVTEMTHRIVQMMKMKVILCAVKVVTRQVS